MGNMLNNLLNNMPMFNIHETASSPSVTIKSKDLQDALGLIKEAVSENQRIDCFMNTYKLAPNDEEKNLIKGIRDDEVKHLDL